MEASLGQTIATSRQAKGLWQWQLAEKLEIKQTMLSRIEAGQVMPSMTALEKISIILDISPDKLRQKALEIVAAMAKCPQFSQKLRSEGLSLN